MALLLLFQNKTIVIIIIYSPYNLLFQKFLLTLKCIKLLNMECWKIPLDTLQKVMVQTRFLCWDSEHTLWSLVLRRFLQAFNSVYSLLFISNPFKFWIHLFIYLLLFLTEFSFKQQQDEVSVDFQLFQPYITLYFYLSFSLQLQW